MAALQSTKKHSTALPVPDFRVLFESAPIAYLVVLPDAPSFTVVAASDAYLQALEKSREDLVGRGVFEVFPEGPSAAHAATSHNVRASFHRILATREPDSMPVQKYDLPRPKSEGGGFEERYWSPVNSPVLGESGEVNYIIHRVENVTERKRAEQCAAFLIRLDDAVRPLTDPREITQTGVRLLCKYLQVDNVTYCGFEADQETFHILGDHAQPGAVSMVGRYTLSMFGAALGKSIQANLPYVVEDCESDSRATDVQTAYRQAGIRAIIVVPLHKGKRLVAAMGVHQLTPRRWRPDEVELVQQVANRCWESIERAQVTRELQASERRRRLAQKAARIGGFEWLMKEHKVIWTPELEALYGVPENTFEESLDHWSRRVVPEDAARVFAGVENCVARRQAEYAYEFRAVLPDGTLRWLRGQAQFFYDETGTPERMLGVNIDVDAQKRAEAHLQQQWHTFDTALSNTPDSNFTFDLQGRFTYANRALLLLWQKSLEEVLGKNVFDLGYPPELAARLQRQVQQVIHTRNTVRDSTPFTDPTGETRHFEYILAPVLDANGRVEAVAGSSRDITERTRAEEVVQKDRRRWRELLLQTPAAIAVLRGPEHAYEWANADYLRLIGRPAGAILGKALREALPEIVSQGYVSMFDRVYQTGEPFVAREAIVLLGEGVLQKTYVNFVCLPTRDSNGRIDGTFVHATDVTDLVTARKHVEESEERYRFLAESMPQMVWTATPDGGLDYVSAQVSAYFGMTPGALLGAGWLAGVHPDDHDQVVERWKHSLTTGEPYETEFRLRRGEDGAWRWFLVRALSMPAPNGKVVSWVGTCTDIHDQKQNEAALRRANRELEEFAYVASHDLQEPLRMVNIYTQLILKRLAGEQDAALTQYAGFVRQGATRMEALLRDLLTFSRTVHKDEELPVGTADLSAALSDALSVLKSRIEESRAIITAQFLPTVHGDTPQMTHVFQNLLSNALKYRKPEIPPEIHISAEGDGDRWIVSVRDNGIGFEPEYAERIFGLFKRLHRDEYPGTGLGLAICQRIVERYGGRMWADGRPGEGATFHFSLPRAEVQ